MQEEIPRLSLAVIGISSIVAYLLGLCIWRLYLSPISNIPGPKLAALTFWYEFYYDVVRGGEYGFKLRELHQQYGPIVRINPSEVHIGDARFHHELYRPLSKGKTNKWDWAVGNLGKIQSGLSTVDHELHRKRRIGYQSYFGRSALLAMEPNLHDIIRKSMSRIAECQSKNQTVDIESLYSAVTCDFIHEYCFQSTLDVCSRSDMGSSLWEASMTVARSGPLLRHLPWIESIMAMLPMSVRTKLNPHMNMMLELKKSFIGIVEEAISVHGTEEEKKLGGGEKQALIHHLLDSDMPPSEKSIQRLRDEAQTMSVAGTVATAQAASHAIYHILANPAMKNRLMGDIKAAAAAAADPEILDLKTVESIPYLTAVIYETLRYTYGTTNRHARIRPDENTVFETDSATYVLPPGTPISMSTPTSNRDPNIWTNPDDFNPERFLPLDPIGNQMWQHTGSFGGGTRICAGKNLALVELHLLIGETMRRFGDDMKIPSSIADKETVEIRRDYIIGRPNDPNTQIRVDWA